MPVSRDVSEDALSDSPLGKQVPVIREYDPGLLCALPRAELWRQAGWSRSPFYYTRDIWTAWELSWLNISGMPRAAVAELHFAGDSEKLIESKSLKRYLFSLSGRQFADREAVACTIEQDLEACLGTSVTLHWQDDRVARHPPQGTNLDAQDIAVECYDYSPDVLRVCSVDAPTVQEFLYSQLFCSRCPITGQPDWANIHIRYHGPRMDHAALLRYIVSFRNHSGFAEQCVDRMFLDILGRCRPLSLSVCCRYLRRGGLDINPCRSSEQEPTWPGPQPRQ